MKKYIPNTLTSMRITLSIISVYLVFIDKIDLAVYIFASSALTDALDGFLARRWKVVSKIGIKLDQVADKLLTLSFGICFIILKEYTILPIIIFELLIVIVNAIFKLIVGFWPISLKAGKIKTGLLFLTLLIGLYKFVYPGLQIPYYILFGITLILEVLAFISYVVYLVYEKRASKIK